MAEYLRLARPYFLLLAVFLAGRLAIGASGVPYARGTNVFSIVVLTLLSCAYYGIFLRRWRSYRLIQAILLGFTLGVVSQLAILAATLLSFAFSWETYFNHPLALNMAEPEAAVTIGQALANRAGGLVGNSIFSGIAAALGWTIGGLLPER